MIQNCFPRQVIVTGAVLLALSLLLCPFSLAEDIPSEREEIPTGYIEDAPKTDGVEGQRLFFHFDADLFYTYSDASDSDALSGYNFAVLAAPTYKINKGTFLSLVYDGSYYKKREFYADDTGYRERSESQSHTISPVLRIDFGENDRFTFKPSLFFTKELNKDTDDADWDDGLYNYEDFGGGIDFQIRDLIADRGEMDDVLTLGFQLYQRNYPNYTSLLDLATGNNTETDEKDYLGLILNAEYRRTQELGLSWALDYSVLIKWLDDKKVVDMNGGLTSEEQEDFLHMLEVRAWYLFEGGFRIGLNLEADIKDSNQNFYEGFGTLSPADDIATSDYYNYFMYRINPTVSYQFRLVPLTLFASYAYEELEYDDRLAENSDGSYRTEKQTDETYTSVIGARYAFNEKWSIVCQWQHIDVDSNNMNESVYQYNYWTDTYTMGVSFRF